VLSGVENGKRQVVARSSVVAEWLSGRTCDDLSDLTTT
jgi:hypothetical protein